MSKWYVVTIGRKLGIYKTWKECEAQVKGYKYGRYKSYGSLEDAQKAFSDGDLYNSKEKAYMANLNKKKEKKDNGKYK